MGMDGTHCNIAMTMDVVGPSLGLPMAAEKGHDAAVAWLLAPGVGTYPNQAETTETRARAGFFFRKWNHARLILTGGRTPLFMAAQHGH